METTLEPVPLLVDIVEDELQFCSELQLHDHATEDYVLYTKTAECLGFNGFTLAEDRMLVVQLAIQDLYLYCCNLYGVKPKPHYTNTPVSEIRTMAQRIQLVSCLRQYWVSQQSLEMSAQEISATAIAVAGMAPVVVTDAVTISLHMYRLDILYRALHMIESDTDITLPERIAVSA